MLNKFNFNKNIKEKENKVLKYFSKHKSQISQISQINQLPKYKKRTKKQIIIASSKLTKMAPEIPSTTNQEKKQIVKMD